ncbi:ATP-binding protein [Pseudokineococcus sp. 1T1Z-3]|uniref:ATP-binding protein n=1 Tax=Pseudokineococcus sp. 1T1Z-3 TaxID=3132745 RepID=UPI0030A0B10E
MVWASDPVGDELARVLAALEAGQGREAIRETSFIDLKEEAGRRDRRGNLQPATERNEAAADALAGEAACMANSDGGGVLVVGVADDGALLGTSLDAQWLRSRIYDLTDRKLTADVRDVRVAGERLLVVRSPQSLEPIPWKRRLRWRVDDRCVEIDATTWHARRMVRESYDWSSLSSHVDAGEAHPQALEIARRHLRASGEDAAADLARATDPEMLRRLNVVDGEGYLSNAGALAFVGRGDPALDYVRRTVPAGDSRRRVRQQGLSLLEEIDSVESAVDAFNEERHVRRGFVIGRLQELPVAVIREAVVNGVVHREWASPGPTTVEHVGRSLTVTSPGGFIGGVSPANIITHPSQPRNRALAELFAALRIAEREGVGVDRMVRDMIAIGYRPPSIEELPGPHVRTALLGDSLDEAWIRFVSRLQPDEMRGSLTVLLLLREVLSSSWFDVTTAAPVLQLNAAETAETIHAFARVTVDGAPLVEPVAGVPQAQAPAWTLTSTALAALHSEDSAVGRPRPAVDRTAVASTWARRRGRISSTELASILGVSPPAMNRLLQGLRDDRLLEPSRSSGTGRGFFYRPTEQLLAQPE